MQIADLHIHSRFSLATGRDCDVPRLDLWARRKGISLVGTGDFTHPQWRRELWQLLRRAEKGLYRLKDDFRLPCPVPGEQPPRFVVSGEISTIYRRAGRVIREGGYDGAYGAIRLFCPGERERLLKRHLEASPPLSGGS